MKLFFKIFSLLVSSRNLREEGANTFEFVFYCLYYIIWNFMIQLQFTEDSLVDT